MLTPPLLSDPPNVPCTIGSDYAMHALVAYFARTNAELNNTSG